MAPGKKFRIAGTGCTLVDYLYKPVHFNDKEFKKYLSKKPGDGGLSPGKLVFREEFEKFSGEPYSRFRNKITGGVPPVAVNIGGPSIVSLIHAAQMLHNLPADIIFYACRGNDEGGEFIENKLSETPLKKGKYKIGKQNTPYTDVLSDPDFENGHGERIFINNIGAAWELMPSDLDSKFFESDMVVFGGTALVPHLHNALGELLLRAKANHAITVVNTVYDFLNEKKDAVRPWLLGNSTDTFKSIDLLITDMEEALRISGCPRVGPALDFFNSEGVGAAIVTHGSMPLHYFSNSQLFGHIASTVLPVSEKIITELAQNNNYSGDTTGCGDNFAGGVIASIANQLIAKPAKKPDLKLAIALGVASGGFACFYNGGTYYEESQGQKKFLIDAYYKDYLKQVDLLKSDVNG